MTTIVPIRPEAGYGQAGRITRAFGTTYYWGALLLDPKQRRHVYAIYALCRLADDIVDAPGAPQDSPDATRAALRAFRRRFDDACAGRPDDPLMAAIGTTVAACRLPGEVFDRFFAAMEMDLTLTSYETFGDLRGYMEGSAAVIGEMMLPVLRPTSSLAVGPARSLGFAFQLTNFLRDVGEDLDRGRVYVPQADLRRHGADPHRREVDDAWRGFMAEQIARNRSLYEDADRGLAFLPDRSRRCVATARRLYSQILDRIEAADYDVFTRRVRVPTWHKAQVALSALIAPSGRAA